MAKKKADARVPEFVCSGPKALPAELIQPAAQTACLINPANAPPAEMARVLAVTAVTGLVVQPQHLAVMTSKWWGSNGVDLAVAFMEETPSDLRNRILDHMNAWSLCCNARFRWTSQLGSAQVRITRAGDGYWSYLGTDILHIPRGYPTMCLQEFTMSTPEGEYKRVVRHETGHTLGFPHEHMLPQIVEKLDPAKTIAWGRARLGWDENTVRSQILTPIPLWSVRMTQNADVNGIMCYGLPAEITRDGQAIPGGTDIDEFDKQFAATLYPPPTTPNPPPKPPDPTDPKPPVGVSTVTKETLKAWLLNAAQGLTVLATFLALVPGLSFLKALLVALASICSAGAGNDGFLDALLALLQAVGLSLPPMIPDEQLKALDVPDAQKAQMLKQVP